MKERKPFRFSFLPYNVPKIFLPFYWVFLLVYTIIYAIYFVFYYIVFALKWLFTPASRKVKNNSLKQSKVKEINKIRY